MLCFILPKRERGSVHEAPQDLLIHEAPQLVFLLFPCYYLASSALYASFIPIQTLE